MSKDTPKTPLGRWAKIKERNQYFNESIAEGGLVLSALIGTSFEAVTLKRVTERTDLSTDKCLRALQTWKEMGWVKQLPDRTWQLTGFLAQFSDQIFDAVETA